MPRQLDRFVRQRHPARRLTVALVVGVSVLICTACDGHLGMTGFVYEDVSLDKPDEVRRNGRFELGGTARPGWYDATLSVSCPGFIPNTHVCGHDRLRHQGTVTMVRVK